MPTHANHAEYWADVAPRLRAYMEGLRDRGYEASLEEALAFYGFMTEDLPTRVQGHRELLPKLSALILVSIDTMRAVLPGYQALSPITLAALVRIALETHITLRFIASNKDPAMWADRYARFAGVEKLLRAEAGLPQDEDAPLFSTEMLEQIRSNSPEWITKKGKLRRFWTGDDDLNSLGAIARKCGLEEEYVRIYTATSKFVHASSLAANGYATPTGLAPIGAPARCKNLAGVAVQYCFWTLKVWCALFVIPLDRLAYDLVLVRVLEPSSQA